MNNLKELTHKQHMRAEGTGFIRRMLKKQITEYEYYVFMSNQLAMYYALESEADKYGVFDGIEEIKRSLKLSIDVFELETNFNFAQIENLNSTSKYIKYIQSISDPERLLAHIYVRHMGDLSGGQIIKRFVPGSGKFYKFGCDIDTLKEKFRTKLHDGLADEAKVCFDMITEFMIELESALGAMGKTD